MAEPVYQWYVNEIHSIERPWSCRLWEIHPAPSTRKCDLLVEVCQGGPEPRRCAELANTL